MESPNIDLSGLMGGGVKTPPDMAHPRSVGGLPADSLDARIAAEESAAMGATPGPKTYRVRGLMGVARARVDPLEYVWNEMPLIKGGIIEIIGAPGVGKSRFLASLAKAQILGRQFGGMNTLDRPKRWLFVGSENGINRLQREAQKFLLGAFRGDISEWTEDEFYAAAARNGFSREQVELLESDFRTFTLEDPEDCLISLNEENCAKLTATLAEQRPDILVCDPWGDVINGDELSDNDVRGTVQALRRCMASAGFSVPVIVVNHSRMGAREVASARGLDAGNFGKNSKCLYSIARYVLNIRPAAKGENPPIEVICAKNNDGRVPPPVAFRLDERTEMYELLDGFDHAAWQHELEGDLRGGRGGLGGSPQMTANDRDDYVRRIHRELILGHGEEPYRKTELCKAIRAAYGGLSARQADLIVMSLTGQAPGTRELAEELGIKCWSRGYPKAMFIGTAEQIAWARRESESKGKAAVSQFRKTGGEKQ